MKKLLMSVALIGVLAGSTLGGLALADKGGDPDYGSSPLGEIEEVSEKIDNLDQNDLAIIEGLGNITDRLDDPEWGLREIKREVRNIEGNVTDQETGLAAIKAEVDGFRSDLDRLLWMAPCTEGVLDVSILMAILSMHEGYVEVYADGELQTLSSYNVYNIDVQLLANGDVIATINKDILEPGEPLSFTFSNVAYETDAFPEVAVRARGSAPWGECVGGHDVP